MHLITACAALLCAVQAFAQTEYPFQDTKLSEEERLDNAVSLMTVDEKIMTIVGQGVLGFVLRLCLPNKEIPRILWLLTLCYLPQLQKYPSCGIFVRYCISDFLPLHILP